MRRGRGKSKGKGMPDEIALVKKWRETVYSEEITQLGKLTELLSTMNSNRMVGEYTWLEFLLDNDFTSKSLATLLSNVSNEVQNYSEKLKKQLEKQIHSTPPKLMSTTHQLKHMATQAPATQSCLLACNWNKALFDLMRHGTH
ncbi:hypothetical protein Pelo_18440 [Pelomyxa schiedti]|nr:hypothetical protein Pelo_18440 [Pelomyxa schiedti]